VIRYEAGQFYKPHHDHAGYYSSGEEAQGDSRPATILLFLSDVEGGGELRFPALGLEFTPAKGDAVAWSNVNVKGLADSALVHEGRPPTTGVKAKPLWRPAMFSHFHSLSPSLCLLMSLCCSVAFFLSVFFCAGGG
jgi:hypothetical protein